MLILGGDFNEDLGAQGEPERKRKLESFIQACHLWTDTTGKTFIYAEGVETSTIVLCVLFPAPGKEGVLNHQA